MSEEIIKQHIKEFGWHFLFVFDPEGESVDFAYSIGFEETYNQPEVIIFGLKKDTAHAILSDIALDLKNGTILKQEQKLSEVIGGGLEIMFKPVNKSAFSKYLGTAVNYYNKPFRASVMFWPDTSNILPTEQNCELTVQNEALAII